MESDEAEKREAQALLRFDTRLPKRVRTAGLWLIVLGLVEGVRGLVGLDNLSLVSPSSFGFRLVHNALWIVVAAATLEILAGVGVLRLRNSGRLVGMTITLSAVVAGVLPPYTVGNALWALASIYVVVVLHRYRAHFSHTGLLLGLAVSAGFLVSVGWLWLAARAT